ncbi:hypothetical protein T484DRAFT_1854392 [Baffinella frigidus]|nr:hypothetical protein T484DRAFT_1854392 [Cryptophyta sp. CCMP2293]
MGGVLEERSALEQMLHVAAEGDVSKLRMLVQSGIPIDQGDYDASYGIAFGHDRSAPAGRDYDGRTALRLATTEARLLAVGLRRANGDYDERTALHLATTEARLLAVSFLLSSSANPNKL